MDWLFLFSRKIQRNFEETHEGNMEITKIF